MATPYDQRFYRSQVGPSRRSAEVVVPLVVDLLHPKSVVDVGCGTATWLSVFVEMGAAEVFGLDGDYVDRAQLQIPEESFIPADLTKPPLLGRRFDLAVSLEVAEHLSEEHAEPFISYLVSLSRAVLFSAAVPLQGGVDHRNEQWQSYWAAKFSDRGYAPYDVVRSAVWGRPEVEWYYAQNILLYAHRDLTLDVDSVPLPMDIVHPGGWDKAHRPRLLSVRDLIAEAPQAVGRTIRHRLRR